MKGAIEAILQELRVKDVTFRIGSGLPEELSYHPGRFAEVWSGSDCLGWFGQIHPLVAKNYGVDAEFYCAELAMDELENAKGADPEYVPCPSSPPSPGTSPWCATGPSPWERWRTASAGAPRGC